MSAQINHVAIVSDNYAQLAKFYEAPPRLRVGGLDTSTGDHEMLFSIKAAIAREQWGPGPQTASEARRRVARRVPRAVGES